MGGSDPFLAACRTRRSYYALGRSSPIPDKKIIDIANQAILHTPSSFNSQSTRALVLLGTEHQHLWGEIAKPAVKAVAPAKQWPTLESRLDGFKSGYGTVLLYKNSQDVATLQRDFPHYADRLPPWSEHIKGMCTFVLWKALEQEGFDANPQHYNPLVYAKVAERCSIPSDWQLKGQLVFGKPVAQPREKKFKSLDERVLVHGAKE